MRSAPIPQSLAFGLILLFVPAGLLRAAPVIDLTNASVLTPPGLSGPEQKAVQMLIEEVEKHSRVRWQHVSDCPRALR